MDRLVHIVPLGWEIDRAVLPIHHYRAHEVHILCNPESRPEQKQAYRQVEKALKATGAKVSLVIVDANDDIRGILRETTRLIKAALKNGDRVYVNMSAAGKVAAAAATIAALAHLPRDRGVVYYVRPESYVHTDEDVKKYGLTRGMKGEPVPLPRFDLRLPPEDGQLILRELRKRLPNPLTYKEAIYLLRDAGVSGFEGAKYEKNTPRAEKNRLNVRFNKGILQKLLAENLVKIRPRGQRREILLTSEGDYVAHLCMGS
ncbi:MAG TPA: DUF6293 family protein [Candidatus Thermoplasmatota archaeon]|nr:DUF6293 family protein [Candidatus Thermoplasmatota archaeon]